MSKRLGPEALAAAFVVRALLLPGSAHAEVMWGDPMGYRSIKPTLSAKTVTLTGKDLTVDQLMEIARGGAQVQYSAGARQQMADNYGLLLEAPTEGVSVYWFTRQAGGGREIVVFDGDPMRPDNRRMLEDKLLNGFRRGAAGGDGPEIIDESLVRAVMAVRANAMIWNAPSPQLAQALIDLLNKGITPVMNSRGSVGEGDLSILNSIGATMVGAGEAYCRGVRMPASKALANVGLKPIQPFAADDNALTSSNAFFTAMTAFVVSDGKEALAWADLAYAIDLNAMNSSVTPINAMVQADRPFKWVNWTADRIKESIKGSYLFGADKGRTIQDPESLRASPIRQASTWQMWAMLHDDLVTQLNSSDHNPAIRTGIGPKDSWDLSTPEMMKYHVKGGKNSNGKSGYVFSNANWDPYPLANDLEAFTISLANMGVAIMTRQERFGSELFTGVGTQAVARQIIGDGRGPSSYSIHEAYQDLQGTMNPVPPEGYVGGGGVEELEGQTKLKAERAMRAVDDVFRLLSGDVNTGMRWLDVRRTQDATRQFGPGPTAAWQAYRKLYPVGGSPALGAPTTLVFLRATPAWTFFPLAAPPK